MRFGADGVVIIAGGAARPLLPGCNADSAIFVARIRGSSRTSYALVRSVSGLDLFTDRPALATDAESGATSVSWTESSGLLAACRGRPIKSSTQFCYGADGRAFSTPIRVPSSGLAGPYGSSLAVSDDGSVLVAVGKYATSGKSRLLVATSRDRGEPFDAAVELTRI